MNISKEQLNEIIELHVKWLRGEKGGNYADLSYANLRGADLSCAILRGAILSYANLRGADLSYANLRSSDYHIERVYTDKAAAEAYCNTMDLYNLYDDEDSPRIGVYETSEAEKFETKWVKICGEFNIRDEGRRMLSA